MNKPVGLGSTPIEPPAPVVLVPKPPPPLPASPRYRKTWVIAGFLALAVLAAVGIAWWLSSANGTISYTTAPVTRGAVTRTVTATGTVNPVLTIIVGTYVSGVIQDLSCDYNTQVKRGQICAKIDPRPYQTVVDQNRANLTAAKAQVEKSKVSLTYAQLTYDRMARLGQTDAVSKDSVDNAKNLYDQARAQVGVDEADIALHEAQLATAQVNLDYTNIVSPVDGTVVSRNVTMGQTVAASFQTPTLFLIATDLTKMQVDTNVSESDIGGVDEGNKATFTVDAFPKRTFEGVVSQVRQSPQTVQNVVTYDVVIDVDNSDLALKPGMTAATQTIIDQRDNVVRVPNQAIRYSPGGSPVANNSSRGGKAPQAQVWVLRDEEPVAIPVVAGLDDDNFTEIVKGELKPDDRVIVAEQRAADGAQSSIPRPRF
jgi:HlyD family secretion protein